MMRFPFSIAAVIFTLSSIQARTNQPDRVARFEPGANLRTRQDSTRDTLPPYFDVRGDTRDSARQVEAAVDALHGKLGLPPPLKLQSYHRRGSTVVIDMVADTLPRLRWTGAGGAVEILADGRRVILRRHN